jgi:hypothetical protein
VTSRREASVVNLLYHGPHPPSYVIREDHVGFEALTAGIKKITIIWHMSPFSLVNQYASTKLCTITPQKAAVLAL